jgi:hypothetical protein
VNAPRRRLAVVVDGAPLPDDEALAFWDRFSAWMEDHRGDLAGFAATEGYASVHPGVDGDKPVLRASKSAAQGPYVPVKADGGGPPAAAPGGSPARQRGAGRPDRRGRNPRDSAGKPRK